jgi:hypothetical protein
MEFSVLSAMHMMCATTAAEYQHVVFDTIVNVSKVGSSKAESNTYPLRYGAAPMSYSELSVEEV